MKHHHSHKALLVIACSTMIFVYAVYGYMRHRIYVSLDKVIENKHLVADRDLSVQKQENVSSLYSASASDRLKMRELFIPEDSTISFIESIEAIGLSSGSDIELSGIEADAAPEGSSVGRIRVHVEAQGSWSAIMKTIMLAEGLPYGVSLGNVHLSAPEDVSVKGKSGWKASFIIEALTLKPFSKGQQ